MSIAKWIERRRWAANLRQAREFRDTLSFSARHRFDQALRPPIKREPGLVIDYPDAIYHITIDDLCRAMRAASQRGGLK